MTSDGVQFRGHVFSYNQQNKAQLIIISILYFFILLEFPITSVYTWFGSFSFFPKSVHAPVDVNIIVIL